MFREPADSQVTLQNRVDPWGQIHAVAARGTMMGNRGGRFHWYALWLGCIWWASRHWICCELHWKEAHHEPMGHGYTSLFFLDEVTALAAGHRPCFFCRRAVAKAFLKDQRVKDFDRVLHAERLGPKPEVAVNGLPDGAMVEIDGTAYAVKCDHLLPWSFGGYGRGLPRKASMRGRLLTCGAILRILSYDYTPRWHESANNGDGT